MIRIITDSAADFEPWELEKMGISCVALNVTFGQREYQENVDLSKDQFYQLLAQTDDLPKTSQAAPQILMDLFEQAVTAGEEAIYICLSSALSGTYQSALMVRQMIDSPLCHVVDSLNGTGGQRMLVEYAVKLRDEGKTAAQIVAGVEALRSRITLFACMDTMEICTVADGSPRLPTSWVLWPTSSPLLMWTSPAVSRCQPRLWVCERAWTGCASG